MISLFHLSRNRLCAEIVEKFEFEKANLTDLTKHMQKLTGINLILDKDLKGKVTISASTAITVGDAWKLI